MIKYSTPNDAYRLFHIEETEDEDILSKNGIDLSEQLAFFKELLDKLKAEPSDRSVQNILNYSRSLNIR